MKRADILQGADYLKSGSPDWEDGHYSNTRVRVLSAGRWEAESWRSRRAEPRTINGLEVVTSAHAHPTATGLLVIDLNDKGQPVRRGDGTIHAYVASLASIRSEWEPAAKVLRERAASRRRYAEQSALETERRLARQAAQREALEAVLGRPLVKFQDWDDLRGLHYSERVMSDLLAKVQA